MKIQLNRENEYCVINDSANDKSSCTQIATLRGGRWDKIHEIARRVYSIDSNSPTLHTNGGGNLEVKILEDDKVNEDFVIRKLTPCEYWKLQGMSVDDFNKAKAIGMSDSQLYKQAGNGLVTNCVQEIMEHLYKALYDESYVCTDETYPDGCNTSKPVLRGG